MGRMRGHVPTDPTPRRGDDAREAPSRRPREERPDERDRADRPRHPALDLPAPRVPDGREEVVSYALTIGDAVALVDPLLPAEDDGRRAPLLADLDALVGAARRLEIMVTIPYHTRSAEVLFERYWGNVATRLWGNEAVRDRFAWDTSLTEIPRDAPGTFATIADGLARRVHDRQPEAPRDAAVLPRPPHPRLRRRRRRAARRRPSRVELQRRQGGLVPEPLPAHARAARRARRRVGAGDARAARDARRTARPSGGPGRAAGDRLLVTERQRTASRRCPLSQVKHGPVTPVVPCPQP